MQPRRREPLSGPLDLAEAYAAVRWRAAILWRRRIVAALAAAVVLAGAGLTAEAFFVGHGRWIPSAGPTTVYYSDGTTVLARLLPAGGAATSASFAGAADSPGPGAGTALAGPAGLIVARVRAELRRSTPLAGRSDDQLDNGGYEIITTVDARAQALLLRLADETVDGSIMSGQDDNLQAAAVVVQPGTGRVLAYYGGHDGTGPDYAAVPDDAAADKAPHGAHPPGQTFGVYTLAAALAAGIAVDSVWDSPRLKEYPASGRGPGNPVRDFNRVPCQPSCTLEQAMSGSLNVPLFGLAERLGRQAVLDAAAGAGITQVWLPGPGARIDLADQGARARLGADVSAGGYPLTVLDHANGVATFAAGGRRADVHFIREVRKGGVGIYRDGHPPPKPVLDRSALDTLKRTLSRHPAGQLPDGRFSAVLTGEWPLAGSAVDTADAWTVGFTDNFAMAVWIGNEEFELPLRDPTGARVGGAGLPAEIYRSFMVAAGELRTVVPTGPRPPSNRIGTR